MRKIGVDHNSVSLNKNKVLSREKKKKKEGLSLGIQNLDGGVITNASTVEPLLTHTPDNT